MLRCRQMIAVQNANVIARQPRVTPRLQLVNNLGGTLGRITHHRLRHAQFHAFELVVNRIIGHREFVPTFAVGSKHRWLRTKYHRLHQIDHRGKKQISFILLDRSPSKQNIQMFRFKKSFENGSGHDADGPFGRSGRAAPRVNDALSHRTRSMSTPPRCTRGRFPCARSQLSS